MDEKMNLINEVELENVAGGAGASAKHVQIVNCKRSCNVRSTPDSDSKTNILGQAHLGDRYLFVSRTGNWYKVKYGARDGYIYKTFIKLV